MDKVSEIKGFALRPVCVSVHFILILMKILKAHIHFLPADG